MWAAVNCLKQETVAEVCECWPEFLNDPEIDEGSTAR